ncbi:hypothetical protein [Candidatus Solirubrobacter pratensis]|uniref:hypothetical protein n=1 Tax=Candidatus Solirubrobacter pratensis TaxID=1298857 RepID=UPI00041E535A|nr:hypothetical protein [Candidatus Solirubrobacter pratensis]
MTDAIIAVELYALVRQWKPSAIDGHGGIHWNNLRHDVYVPVLDWVKDNNILTLYERAFMYHDPVYCELGILPREPVFQTMLDFMMGEDFA